MFARWRSQWRCVPKAPAPVRSENIIPFESWEEVEAVAAACGRWAPIVMFMADTGARPGEVQGVEHTHVHGSVVELPGTKTVNAWRAVHLTERGVAAIQSVPRAISTPSVFHLDGKPVSWPYFTSRVWRPALKTAGLPHRRVYCLRHTFAYFSLRAGVPISTVAREMGHADVSTTFKVYGGWCMEMGAEAAVLRSAWAKGTAEAHDMSADV